MDELLQEHKIDFTNLLPTIRLLAKSLNTPYSKPIYAKLPAAKLYKNKKKHINVKTELLVICVDM